MLEGVATQVNQVPSIRRVDTGHNDQRCRRIATANRFSCSQTWDSHRMEKTVSIHAQWRIVCRPKAKSPFTRVTRSRFRGSAKEAILRRPGTKLSRDATLPSCDGGSTDVSKSVRSMVDLTTMCTKDGGLVHRL